MERILDNTKLMMLIGILIYFVLIAIYYHLIHPLTHHFFKAQMEKPNIIFKAAPWLIITGLVGFLIDILGNNIPHLGEVKRYLFFDIRYMQFVILITCVGVNEFVYDQNFNAVGKLPSEKKRRLFLTYSAIHMFAYLLPQLVNIILGELPIRIHADLYIPLLLIGTYIDITRFRTPEKILG